jgi:hypothetical protein
MNSEKYILSVHSSDKDYVITTNEDLEEIEKSAKFILKHGLLTFTKTKRKTLKKIIISKDNQMNEVIKLYDYPASL